jgi:tripartite-type tricarboxylate transporter receptor subunit TctC
LEQGFDLEFSVHYVWYAPAEVTDATIALLANRLQTVFEDESLQKTFQERSLTPAWLSGPELDTWVSRQYAEIQRIADRVLSSAREKAQ